VGVIRRRRIKSSDVSEGSEESERSEMSEELKK